MTYTTNKNLQSIINWGIENNIPNSRLPKNSKKLAQLRKLNLSHLNIYNLPKEISLLSSVIKLDLSTNKITNLPNAINKMKRLKYLDLSNNQFDKLPNSLRDLQQLRTLNISHNPIYQLPSYIEELTNLKEFTAINCNIPTHILADFIEQINPEIRRKKVIKRQPIKKSIKNEKDIKYLAEEKAKKLAYLNHIIDFIKVKDSVHHSQDILLKSAIECIVEYNKEFGAPLLQRQLSIGFPRATNILDQLTGLGVISWDIHSGRRKIIFQSV
ncbi:DNA translocase FtsK [Pasteurella atlantica]|uniref:leucine-rich repeat domain-containing protein n=1 Tax=Pasteurellaceae TaxID=712 RepID=UPI00276DC7D7|nr:DNA translocase FtsK [Pasteurella atlantica]MDP8034193.1 DNA translocase FtsK [Pasteurella atlantica]MDP8036144.1 DNA translocase FtsK [Pasteurella atlantica]MDP8038094.1 DNA translocase FtsK [Pasteurella atlantica]MDP8048449.1 DNA translocase FtsK [Pasteurella atlantica]MDP8050406.1 DNA translocase FtsK [Pasteurella atlantica]